MADKLRTVPGMRIVAPEVWKICPPIEGRNLLAAAALSMLTGKARPLQLFAETIVLEGDGRHRSTCISRALSSSKSCSRRRAAAGGSWTRPTWASPTS